ncbi:MAG: DUF3108 domain-containing protein [Bacteroidales bacterium]
MKKKHFVFLIFLSLLFPISAKQQAPVNFMQGKQNESLNYDVYFQWGFIWKKAGMAVLAMEPSYYAGNPSYFMSLTGRTTPFFDKVTKVRDTLIAHTTKDIKPLHYEKVVHEGDYAAKDLLKYNYPDSGTNGHVKQFRSGTLRRDTTIHVKGDAYDMLSVFYFIRQHNLEEMKPGEIINTIVFSGRHAHKVQIQYVRDDRYKTPNNKNYDCYLLKVYFFDENGKVNKNDNIDVWISKTPDKKPVHMAGKLKVGYLRAIINE